MQHKAVNRTLIIVAISAILLGLFVTAAIVFQRNRWPAAVTKELADLRARKIPVTLQELDLQYSNLRTGKDVEAVAHFNEAFKLLPNVRVPGFGRLGNKGNKTAYLNFDPEMLLNTPALHTQAMALLEQNTELFRLLHDGLKYETCHFPIKHADGWDALMPHLGPCHKAAALLALEAVYRARENDSNGAIAAISACLHMAEIIRDEPCMISFLIRHQIVADACHAVQACLNITSLPGDELRKLNRRILSLMERRSVKQMLISERCLHLSIFMAQNKTIARFAEQDDPKLMTIFSVEMMRWRRILHRDCAFDLECFAKIERTLDADSCLPLVNIIGYYRQAVEFNKGLVGEDTAQVNIISGMLLPGFFQALERHVRGLSLAEATSAAIAVERYRESKHRLPARLAELPPNYLPMAMDNALTTFPLEIISLDGGYSIIQSNDPSNVLFEVKR